MSRDDGDRDDRPALPAAGAVPACEVAELEALNRRRAAALQESQRLDWERDSLARQRWVEAHRQNNVPEWRHYPAYDAAPQETLARFRATPLGAAEISPAPPTPEPAAAETTVSEPMTIGSDATRDYVRAHVGAWLEEVYHGERNVVSKTATARCWPGGSIHPDTLRSYREKHAWPFPPELPMLQRHADTILGEITRERLRDRGLPEARISSEISSIRSAFWDWFTRRRRLYCEQAR